MNILFDLHGVLDRHPKRFRSMIYNLRRNDDIYLCSGSPEVDILNQLRDLCIPAGMFSGIFSLHDYIVQNYPGQYKITPKGIWFDEEKWWQLKAYFVHKYSIDMMFDDHSEYFQHVSDTVVKCLVI